MKHVMLSLTGLLLALDLLLAGCQDQSCTLETTLESGQTLQFSGCPVTEQTTEYRLTKDAATAETARLFVAEGRPTLSIAGAKEEDLTVRFAKPLEDGYCLYEPNTVMPKLDYRATQDGDTLNIRLRTVYNYVITVQTDAGSEYFLVTTQM